MGRKYVASFNVVENIAYNASNFLIRLKSPDPLPEINPGQFVNVDIPGTSDVFLRRPFSVFEVDYESQVLS